MWITELMNFNPVEGWLPRRPGVRGNRGLPIRGACAGRPAGRQEAGDTAGWKPAPSRPGLVWRAKRLPFGLRVLGLLRPSAFASRLALASLLLLWPVHAQEGLENLISTAGTTIQDGAGRHWAYLFWQGSSPELVLGRTYAVYAKPGDATAAAPYTRVSVVSQQTDARNIEPLLRRAENLGEDPVKLQQDLQSVFEALMPAASISRAEQVSAAIRGSLTREDYFQNLLLMARVHPGVALALGVAYADVLPTLTTYEVRLFDPATETDQGVIGRVTLQPGAPLVLPAPGAPVEVPDTSAQGDINVKLRWASPDPLRRVGLLQYGFNVWRVSQAYAEAASNRWDLAPPPALLLAATALTAPNHVKRCNNLPILTDKDFTAADVANFSPPPAGDPDTFFYSDDDGRFRPGYVNVGFTNGARFYYFATARDILGRDGLVSPGTLVTVCDRNPPLPPDGVRVVNDYSFVSGTPRQFLRVIWNQSTNTADPVTNYWVYRWTNIHEMHARAGNPSNNLVAVVAHTNGVTTASYLDDGAGAPSVPADLGRTYWYTVRAQDCGACGPNLSGNSAPAFGVLRDRVGPDAPRGEIQIHCLKPEVHLRNFGDPIGNAGPSGKITFRLTGHRTSRQIAQIAFMAAIFDEQGQAVEGYFSGWLYYSPGETMRHYTFSTGSKSAGRVMLVWASTMTFDGQPATLTNPVPVYVQEAWINDIVPINFEAGLQSKLTYQGGDCTRHNPVTPDGVRTNVVIIGYPTPTSREWRLYRQVDGGPLTLLCHGAVGGAASFSCQDDGLPPNSATICYFLQVLDEHGNPSPMVKLGCITTAPAASPPTPLLSPLLATGVTDNPGMTMTWFCPPPGLERFEVWIAGTPNAVNSNLAPGFLALRPSTVWQPNPVQQTLVLNGQTNTYDFYKFLTPRIGPGFGPGPQFAVPCSIELGETYTVFVKAVAGDGTVGEASNIEQFVWNPANTNFPICTIPWPARGLPPLNTSSNFTSGDTNAAFGITAAYYQAYKAPFTGAVVLVGSKLLTSGEYVQVEERPQWLSGTVNPMSLLFTNGAGESLFPMVLYRYQVTNSQFPQVSGDIVQVSPMLENIAYEITNYCVVLANQRICYTNSLLRDSYIVYDRLTVGDNYAFFFMFVTDTQPVISGARYKYLLVRFRKNGEIAEVIPTNEMEVP